MNNPVLFLIFNRPDIAKQTFAEIAKAKPPRLYIACDGARASKEGEAELIAETRKIKELVDWQCEVKTLFQNENLGCGQAVSTAITWFFENEEQGIILEDDCLPNESFFKFCEELLDKYKDNDNIGIISGNNFQIEQKRGEHSYYFSNLIDIWGWATWARVWKDFRLNVNELNEMQIISEIEKRFSDRKIINFWTNIYEKMKNFEINTWDYQFYFSQIAKKRIFIDPNVNLISNIGFGENCTHTIDASNPHANIPTKLMNFPLSHPKEIEVNHEADKFYFDNFIFRKKNIFKRIVNKLRKIFNG